MSTKPMTKWSTISGRINEEEKAVIDKWEKKMGMTDNQLVRGGVSVLIGFLQMGEIFLRDDMEPIRSFAKNVQKITDSKKYQKDLERVQEEWLSSYKEEHLEKLERELKQIGDELKVFEKHKKRGPVPKKKKRGRPKDKGIESKS